MLSEENKKSEPFSYREKVRIFIVWCTKKNQNTFVFWFFFLSARWKGLEQGGGAQRRKQSHSAALLSLRVPTRRNVYRGSCEIERFHGFFVL